jgi:hypothetical protein
MVYALGGTFYGIIRKAQREGRRIILTLESSEGKDVDVWADECSTNLNAAKMMRAAKAVGKEVSGARLQSWLKLSERLHAS